MNQVFSNYANLTVEKVSINQPFDGCQDLDLFLSDHKPEQKSFEKNVQIE